MVGVVLVMLVVEEETPVDTAAVSVEEDVWLQALSTKPRMEARAAIEIVFFIGD